MVDRKMKQKGEKEREWEREGGRDKKGESVTNHCTKREGGRKDEEKGE